MPEKPMEVFCADRQEHETMDDLFDRACDQNIELIAEAVEKCVMECERVAGFFIDTSEDEKQPEENRLQARAVAAGAKLCAQAIRELLPPMEADAPNAEQN